jgi:hypothetical protein
MNSLCQFWTRVPVLLFLNHTYTQVSCTIALRLWWATLASYQHSDYWNYLKQSHAWWGWWRCDGSDFPLSALCSISLQPLIFILASPERLSWWRIACGYQYQHEQTHHWGATHVGREGGSVAAWVTCKGSNLGTSTCSLSRSRRH